MPFCTQCGSQVSAADAFCPACGARQEGAVPPPNPPAGSPPNVFDTWSSRTWATLAYIPVLGWLASVYILAAQRFAMDRITRFHAFQGLYLFVAWLVLDWGVGPFFAFSGDHWRFGVKGLLQLALFGTGIFMLVKTHNREDFRLPIFGELAERSVAEQR